MVVANVAVRVTTGAAETVLLADDEAVHDSTGDCEVVGRNVSEFVGVCGGSGEALSVSGVLSETDPDAESKGVSVCERDSSEMLSDAV